MACVDGALLSSLGLGAMLCFAARGSLYPVILSKSSNFWLILIDIVDCFQLSFQGSYFVQF